MRAKSSLYKKNDDAPQPTNH